VPTDFPNSPEDDNSELELALTEDNSTDPDDDIYPPGTDLNSRRQQASSATVSPKTPLNTPSNHARKKASSEKRRAHRATRNQSPKYKDNRQYVKKLVVKEAAPAQVKDASDL